MLNIIGSWETITFILQVSFCGRKVHLFPGLLCIMGFAFLSEIRAMFKITNI